MKRRKSSQFVFILTLIFNLTAVGLLRADDTNLPPTFGQHFEKGRFEASLDGGALFAPVIAKHLRPSMDYSLTEVQLGYMLTDVSRTGIFRGNFELTADLFGGAFFTGPGDYAAGMTLWARYNFVPENQRFVPYAQAGAGVTAADLDRHVEGEIFNFNLDIGFGCRCFLARNWALDLECRYQHISNAGLANHNLGVNAIGPVIGISYFF